MKTIITLLFTILALTSCQKDVPAVTLQPIFEVDRSNNYIWRFEVSPIVNNSSPIKFMININGDRVQVTEKSLYEMQTYRIAPSTVKPYRGVAPFLDVAIIESGGLKLTLLKPIFRR